MSSSDRPDPAAPDPTGAAIDLSDLAVLGTPRRHRPPGFLGAVAVVVVVLFIGTMVTILIAIAVWPGEVKLVAPLFCDDAQPDAFVVADTYSPEPGETVTNFTLYCMGPAGDATDHGFFLPFLATMALNTIVLVLAVAALGLIGRLRRLARRRPRTRARDVAPPGSTAGPFVD